MAWTAPSTWVADQQVTKAQFNAWNACLASAGDHGGWSTWAPWFVMPGSTGINEAQGSAVSGWKMRLGDIGVASFNIVWDDGPSAAGGSGGVRLVLPYTAHANQLGKPAGWAVMYDPNTDDTWLMVPEMVNAGHARFRLTNASLTDCFWDGETGGTNNGWPIPDANDYGDVVASGFLCWRTA